MYQVCFFDDEIFALRDGSSLSWPETASQRAIGVNRKHMKSKGKRDHNSTNQVRTARGIRTSKTVLLFICMLLRYRAHARQAHVLAFLH